MKFDINLNFFKIDLGFTFRLEKKDFSYAIGTYSLCSDGKHCVYLDYDNFREEWLTSEIKFLIEKYKLSDFYIFISSSNLDKVKFHAICFDKLTARYYNDIVMESNADMLFRNNSFFDLQNARVLRFSAKTESQINRPKFHKLIKSPYNLKQKSLSHITFYEKMFDIKIRNKSNNDNINDIGIIKYATLKRG